MVVVVFFLALLYNLALITGTVYLVEFYDWSPWWFCLTALLMWYKTDKKEIKSE